MKRIKLLATVEGEPDVRAVDLEKIRAPQERRMDGLAADIGKHAQEIKDGLDAVKVDLQGQIEHAEARASESATALVNKSAGALRGHIDGIGKSVNERVTRAFLGQASATAKIEDLNERTDRQRSEVNELKGRVLELEQKPEPPERIVEKITIEKIVEQPVPVAEIAAAVDAAIAARDLKPAEPAEPGVRLPAGGDVGQALVIVSKGPRRKLGWADMPLIGGGGGPSIVQRKQLASLTARVEALEQGGGGNGGTGDLEGPASSTDRAVAIFDGVTGKLLGFGALILDADGRLTALTDPTGLQDAATKAYVDAAIASVNVGGSFQNSFLVSGGQVVWIAAYTFLVSAATYFIGGVLYTSAQQQITLDAAHATLDRIDVIAVNTAGTVVKITGTAATQPSEPDTDPGSQLKLSIVFVGANTVAPGTSAAEIVYSDFAASGEWDMTTNGSGWTLNSATDPRSGTTCIDATAVAAGAYVQGQIPNGGTLDPSVYDFLVFNIKAKSQWANNRGLQVTLRSNGVIKGGAVVIQRSGTFGFDSQDTSIYQQIAIPISLFSVPPGTLISQMRASVFGGAINFRANDISFVCGANLQPSTGITQEQADARYGFRVLQTVVTDPAGSVIAIGDRQGAPIIIPAELNGWKITRASGHVTTASTSGPVTVQLHNLTRALDLLSTRITIIANSTDSNAAGNTPSVINTANQIVNTGDEIWADIDTAGANAKGLIVTATFERA